MAMRGRLTLLLHAVGLQALAVRGAPTATVGAHAAPTYASAATASAGSQQLLVPVSRSAWAAAGGFAPTAVVTTNAPVLRWSSKVESGGTFAYTVDVSTDAGTAVWTSGEVWQGNWPAHAPAFPGLCVYEGPPLEAGVTYTFRVSERQAADGSGRNVSTSWTAGSGRFQAHASLPSARDELVATLQTANVSRLWNTSRHSIVSSAGLPSGGLILKPSKHVPGHSCAVRQPNTVFLGAPRLH